MDIFWVVLESVLILLGIGLVGFWITRRGVMPENAHSVISRIAIDIALPCMVFAGIVANFSPEEMPDWWQLPLWFFAYTAASLAISLSAMFLARKETRSEFAMNLFYQNGLFFPLVIISGIFGLASEYLAQLYIFIMLHPVMFFTTYFLFFRKQNPTVKFNWVRVFNPILIATVLGVGLQFTGLRSYLPDFLKSILEILGGMALPLIMIVLGGSLYLDFRQRGKIYTKEILKFLLIKNIVYPLIFLGLIWWLKLPYPIALILILQAAVPPVTSTPILTERAGGNKTISNQFVFTSFVFSAISIPLIFWLFSHYFPMP
jgi:malate permease and related proteins